MSGGRLLLVDDEENLRTMLAAALRHSRFDVDCAASGREGLDLVRQTQPDLVILDVMLPDLDGFEVCRRLRSDGSRVPVLFLTARDDTDDRVRGLTLGGDDYLVKPFSLEELVARVNAVLRRTNDVRTESVLRCADLVMDDDAHRVTRGGEQVDLSPTEYNLLHFLLANQGRVMSKAQILDHVWDYDFGGHGGVVETYIAYLRRKLDTVEPKLIQTVRGIGYVLRGPVEDVTVSLRTRVLLGLALIAVLLVGTALVVTRTTERYLVDQVDNQLAGLPSSRAFVARAFAGGTGAAIAPPPGTEQRVERPSPVFVGVISDGRVETLFAPDLGVDESSEPSIDVEQAAAAADGSPFTTDAQSGGSRFRVQAVRDPATDLVVVQALPLDATDEIVSRLVLAETIATAVILAVLALVGWWVTRLGVRPVKEMAHTATLIAAGDLSQRVREQNPQTEAGELGQAMNTMLSSIETAFEERKASEQRLRQFLADASHELRTPVATIRGYAELYRNGGLDSSGKLDDAMRRTEQESIRMGVLVEAMLELARLDQGRPLERRPVDLAELARDVGQDAVAVDPSRSVRVDADGRVMVCGDADHLHQVAANLVGNALAHTDPGTSVCIRARTEPGLAILEVSDEGPGMPADVADRIFERFYRVDAARSRRNGGAGLGLSIVDAVVRAHGGAVTVDTAPGAGTRVRVSLPTVTEAPRPEPAPSDSTRAEGRGRPSEAVGNPRQTAGMRTKATDLVGIDLPIFAFSHCRDVVAAVTNAGGCGVLGAVAHSPEQLDIDLDWIEAEVKGKPYGIDLLVPEKFVGAEEGGLDRDALSELLPPEHRAFLADLLERYDVPEPADDVNLGQGIGGMRVDPKSMAPLLDVCFAHRPGIVASALGPPPPHFLDRAHEAGIPVAVLAGSVVHVERHAAAGADIIVAQGTEAGGHTGMIATMVLVPEVVDAVAPLPVLAAGGIGNGRQLAAGMALGADGAWCGSVWLTTEEAETPPEVKEKFLAAGPGDTVRSRSITGKPARMLRTAWTDEWEREDGPGPLPMPIQPLLVGPAMARIYRGAATPGSGANQLATYFVGQVVGTMNAVKPTKRVVFEMIEEFIEAVERLDGLLEKE